MLLALPWLAGACAGSGYDYVENRSEGLFVKYPDDWTAHEVDFPDQADELGLSCCWARVIDGYPSPAIDNLDAPLPDHPVGLVQIIDLPAEERDQVSLGYLRSLAMGGTDPFQVAQGGETDLTVTDYEDLTTDAGFHGNRIEFTLDQGDGQPVRVEHVAMTDADTTQVYRMVLYCTVDCFDEHQRQIDTMFDSWTIDE